MMKPVLKKILVLLIFFKALTFLAIAQDDSAKGQETVDVNSPEYVQNQNQAQYEEAGIAELNRRKALLALERQQLELEKEKGEKWLAFVMPFAAFIFVLALLSIIFGFERKKDRNRHETIRIYLEKGLEVPPQLLVPVSGLPPIELSPSNERYTV